MKAVILHLVPKKLYGLIFLFWVPPFDSDDHITFKIICATFISIAKNTTRNVWCDFVQIFTGPKYLLVHFTLWQSVGCYMRENAFLASKAQTEQNYLTG